jgi:DNA-binding NtrC family response regulator
MGNPQMSRNRNEAVKELELLLVDDDPESLDSISELLGMMGYKCHRALSASEALEAFKKQRFDAVVTDFKMPGADGLELIRSIKQFNSSVPAIIITAHSDREMVREAGSLGAFGVLFKPVRTDILLDLLQSVTRTSHMKQKSSTDNKDT